MIVVQPFGFLLLPTRRFVRIVRIKRRSLVDAGHGCCRGEFGWKGCRGRRSLGCRLDVHAIVRIPEFRVSVSRRRQGNRNFCLGQRRFFFSRDFRGLLGRRLVIRGEGRRAHFVRGCAGIIR